MAAEAVVPQDIPSDQVTLDPTPTSNVPASPDSSPEIDPSQVQVDQDPYATPLQTGIAHAEAVGRGLAGPLATGVERFAGVPAADIKAREAANPEAALTEAGTFGASMLAGVGEAHLIGQAGLEAAEAVTGASRLARAAVRTGVETSLMQTGDEVNKMILGDPASASDVALAAGIGLVGGPALESVPMLWKAGKEAAAGRWLRTAGDAVVEAEPAAMTAAKKVGKGLFGVPEQATESYLKNVEGVQKASDDLWDVAEKLPKAVSDTGAVSRETSREGRGLLSDVRDAAGIDANDVIQKLRGLPSKEAQASAIRLEEELAARRGSVEGGLGKENLTEREIRDVIDDVKKDVNYDVKFPTPEKAALRSFAGELNGILREHNPAYAEKMGMSAANVELKKDLIKKLRLVQDYSSEHGWKPTDTTVSRLKDLARGDKRDVADILDSLKKLGHEDLATEVKNTLTKQAFAKDATRGSRLTTLGGITGASLGHLTGIPGAGEVGAVAGGWLGTMADRYGPQAYYDVLGKLAKKAPEALGLNRLKPEHATMALTRAITADESSGSGARAAVDYTAAVAAGESRIRKAVEATVKRGGMSLLPLKPDAKVKDKIKKAVTEQENNPDRALQAKNDLATHMPENAASLTAAKTRVLSYLSTLKPKPAQGLPFDDVHKDPMAEARYDRAVQTAASPLSVLSRVQDGTLAPDDVKDLNNMFPGLAKTIREKAFAQLVDTKHGEAKPSYAVRQSLSLLMGTPLDSTFTPQNIVAAQAAHGVQKAAQQDAGSMPKPRKKANSLQKLAGSHATGDQAAAARAQGGFNS